ncbi:hypothetical protein ANO11243_041640 [Dothideomycetidae sp. 11243]|nr:hypothetical protein ANO11243_041640 [fungal sp. No.11243]
MATEDAALKVKVARFEELYALDDSQDDEPDEGLLQSMAMLKRKRSEKSEPLAQTSSSSMTAISKRDRDAPEIPAKLQKLSRTTSAPPSLISPHKTASSRQLRRTSTLPKSVVTTTPTSDPADVAPKPAKLFSGLHFYFFPNNLKNPGRKFRIQKAEEYGAKWEQAFSATVTHIVVDRSMNYDQILQYLRLDAIPQQNIHVVDERYPADCISFRSIVDAGQRQYYIKGYKPQQVSEPTVIPRADSLQLKPAGRAVQTREPQTLSQRTTTTLSDPSPVKPASMATTVEDPSPGKRALEPSDSSLSAGWERPGPREQIVLSYCFGTDSRQLIDDDDDQGTTSTATTGTNLLDLGSSTVVPKWQQRFQCMQQNTGKNEDSPNAETIALLQEMAEYYTQIKDEWRPIAYRKAIATLRKHPVKVTTKEAAEKLPFIGERLAAKIEEITFAGFLQRLQSAREEPADQVLQLFLKVYGIGYAKGMRLVAQGYKTLEDLRTKADLDQNQKIGLEHFDDFNTRVPRLEVKQHSDLVAKAAKNLNEGIQVYTMGSYRRGAESTGDIDLVITHANWPMTRLRVMVIDSLVPQLFKQGFLKCALAATSRQDGSKWHGASCLPGSNVWRRIDFLLVPAEELGAALIYFTGNDIFNRSMRLLASKKGMRLNQRGLYKDVMRGKSREKLTEGELVEGRDEKKIFAILGVPWREPWERIC